MKFLHTADLHLGKTLCDVSLLADQEHILNEILEIARTEQVDGVLVSGDVYQSSAPSAEAMQLWEKFVSALLRDQIPLYAISGNHDSDKRLAYLSAPLEELGIHVTPVFDGTVHRVDTQDEFGPVTLYLLPFLRPAQVRRFFPEEKITNSQEAMEVLLSHLNIDPTRRNILLAHQYVTGAEFSLSEEDTVGTADPIPAELFEPFDYTALGHLHRAQTLHKKIRYPGTPLKYDFSEVKDKKTVSLIELREKGELTISMRPLHPKRDLVILKDTMKGFEKAAPVCEDYVWAVITDELVPPDARVTLAMLLPGLMKVTVENSKTGTDAEVVPLETLENKNPLSLFQDFYAYQNNGQPPTDEHIRLFRDILKELEETL